MHRHGGVRGTKAGMTHPATSATLGKNDRGNHRETADSNQEAAHGEYLGSRAAGPFLHVHT